MTEPTIANSDADPREIRKIRAGYLKEWGQAGQRQSRLASGFGLLQALLFCGFAWGVADAVNALANGSTALTGIALALVSAGLRAASQTAESHFGFEASAQVRASIRVKAAKALASQGPQFTQLNDTGAFTTGLVEAVDKLDGYFGRYKPLLPVVAGAPLILLVAAFTQSYVVAIIFLVTAPLLIVFMAIVGAAAASASKDQLDTLMRLAGRFHDRLQALETLNAFNAASSERDGLAVSAELFRKKTMRVLAMAFLSSSVLEFFSAIAVAGTAVYVGFSLLGELPFDAGETIDLRAGLFVLILAPEFYMPLRRLSAAYHDRADADAAVDQLAAFFAEQDKTSTPSERVLQTAPSLRFSKVNVVYNQNRQGLSDFSFDAQAGKITALWGPSGVGKSTALKVLLNYAPLTSGQIEMDGQWLDGPLLGQAAWIAQRPRIFHGTLRDNITVFDDSISNEAVTKAADQAGVMDFVESLPDGLDTQLGDRGAGVSGGQAQRIALARALAVDMKLLLLDEPTAHLDALAETRFIEALKTAAQGRTVLIATHSAALREACDQVIDMGQMS
jgi:ATP-binding cassette subfamily C protein CydD